MNIVLLDTNTLGNDIDFSIFESLGHVTIYGFTKEEDIIERIKDAHVIITNKMKLTKENLSKAPNAALICLPATGTNNIDLDYAKSRGIIVSNVVAYSTNSVAQHTFSMLFYLYEKSRYYDDYVKSGSYINDHEFKHYETRFHELAGKTWGIVGLGNIGKKVALIAESFSCKVIYYSTSGKNSNPDYTQVTFDQLILQADIISIHAPLNEDTQGLFNYKVFKQMKTSAYILNLGRGPIIVESDLVTALKENSIAGAGLDVLDIEPMTPNNPLLSINNSSKLYVTPHIGWASIEARRKANYEVFLNVKSFKNGIPRNCVNP